VTNDANHAPTTAMNATNSNNAKMTANGIAISSRKKIDSRGWRRGSSWIATPTSASPGADATMVLGTSSIALLAVEDDSDSAESSGVG